jgi:hypothetical protein
MRSRSSKSEEAALNNVSSCDMKACPNTTCLAQGLAINFLMPPEARPCADADTGLQRRRSHLNEDLQQAVEHLLRREHGQGERKDWNQRGCREV